MGKKKTPKLDKFTQALLDENPAPDAIDMFPVGGDFNAKLAWQLRNGAMAFHAYAIEGETEHIYITDALGQDELLAEVPLRDGIKGKETWEVANGFAAMAELMWAAKRLLDATPEEMPVARERMQMVMAKARSNKPHILKDDDEGVQGDSP